MICSVVQKRWRMAISPATRAEMRRLPFQDFIYSAVTNIVIAVIFAAYSSKCTVSFEMFGKHCSLLREKK